MNKQIVLAEHPQGMPNQQTFRLESASIPSPEQDEVLVRNHYLSVDPYLRGCLGGRASMHPQFALNECIASDGIAEVVQSNSALFQKGDLVTGRLHWSLFAKQKAHCLQKIEQQGIAPTAYLGPLGMAGMTAYFGLGDIGQPKAHEVVLISGAGGAVGMFAGALAKAAGCYVVGITGSDEKAKLLQQEYGFDAAVNYKSPNFLQTLTSACPRGVDIYFDNVGGTISDQAFTLLNKRARIVLSGQISTSNSTAPDVGLRPFRTLIVKSVRCQGFIVWDYLDRFPEGIEAVKALIIEGKMKWHETITPGLENLPKAFLGLFSGDNFGKQLVSL